LKTKAEIALALLDEARACGVRHRCVTCDADYGDNPHFLNGLEQRAERQVVAVRADFSVTRGRQPQSPVRRAAAVLAAQPRYGSGAPSRGARGPKAGGAPSFWRGAAGASMAMAAAIWAG
jgi:DDE superfamily endonuclease